MTNGAFEGGREKSGSMFFKVIDKIEGGVKLGLLRNTFSAEEISYMRAAMVNSENGIDRFQLQFLDALLRASFNANYIPPIVPFLQWMDDLGVSRKVVGEYLQKSIADQAKTYHVAESISYTS